MTNYFNCAAQIASKDELRYTADNQTAVIDMKLSLTPPYGSIDSFTIKAVAWGKVAEQLAKIEEGTIVWLEGQLNMLTVQHDGYKETIASLKIAKVITELPTLINHNHIEILGNVGGDVESRYFDGDKNKAQFTLAVRRTKDNPDWFKVELWGKTADTAQQYVVKGSTVGISGHLTLQSWTDKATGEVRTKPVIVADRLTLASKKDDRDQSQYSGQSSSDSSDRKAGDTPSNYGTVQSALLGAAYKDSLSTTRQKAYVENDIPF